MRTPEGASIDFSAQFGGRDAAAAVLGHFKALKAAAKGICIEKFPLPKLAFILRVDGEVNEYNLSGPGNPEVGSDGSYLSIDLGISRMDRDDLRNRIATAILDSIPLIQAVLENRKITDFDPIPLKNSLGELCKRYMK
jgi:hypothetical protein